MPDKHSVCEGDIDLSTHSPCTQLLTHCEGWQCREVGINRLQGLTAEGVCLDIRQRGKPAKVSVTDVVVRGRGGGGLMSSADQVK